MQPVHQAQPDAASSASPPSGGPVLAHLERILKGEAFSGAWRQQRLLRFLIVELVEGRAETLKEYSLGVAVFDKSADFDPRLDSIVRVEASRLRTRLNKYYAAEGRGDNLRIELPRGSYVLKVSAAEVQPAPEGHPLPPVQPVAAARATGRPVARWVALGAVCLALAAALIWNRPTRATIPGGPESDYAFRRITSEQAACSYPSLSPDGRQLAYARRERGNWDIFVRDLGGGEPHNLTPDSSYDDWQPAFAPDAKQIVFRSERDGGGLFLTDTSHSSVRRLTDFGYHPAWSPDGKQVVFSRSTFYEPEDGPGDRFSTLHSVEAATGVVRQLTSREGVFDALQPAFSPHGNRIAFWGADARGQRDIWTMPASGGEPEKVRATPVTQDYWVDWSPAWSPDGRFLYFSSDREGATNLWRVRIAEATGTAQGPLEAVRTPSSYSAHVSASADGRSLAYVRRHVTSRLYSAPFDPTKGVDQTAVMQLTATARIREPAMSPDGRWLAVRVQDPEEDIALIRPDGSGFRRLTDDAHKDRTPYWSPDGTYIRFLSDQGGSFAHWTIRPDGSGRRRLESRGRMAWWPDGSLVVYPRGREPFVVDPQGRPLPSVTLPMDFRPVVWSPDGRRVAGRMASLPRVSTALYVYSLDTRQSWNVSESGWYPIWLKDSRRLLFQENGAIRLADTDARRVRVVFAPQGRGVDQRFALSSDQRGLYFVFVDVEEQIWLAQRR